MADNISIRGGNKKGMPTLRDRELAFVRDEEALYIGSPDGNLKLCSADTERNLTQFIEETKRLFEEGLEAIKTQLADLQARVLRLEQSGGGGGSNITATHDGYGNVTLSGVSAIHIGNGKVVLSGASAFHSGNGNVRLA